MLSVQRLVSTQENLEALTSYSSYCKKRYVSKFDNRNEASKTGLSSWQRRWPWKKLRSGVLWPVASKSRLKNEFRGLIVSIGVWSWNGVKRQSAHQEATDWGGENVLLVGFRTREVGRQWDSRSRVLSYVQPIKCACFITLAPES